MLNTAETTFEGHIRTGAVRLLKQYVAANPDRRADLGDESGWWFRGLLDYPQFQELVRAK